MDEKIKNRCIKCGSPADQLYRLYGNHTLRLTQCDICGNIADKYIEYDPSIIIIDLVLLSKDAYRHVLYNTRFNIFWRLFLILIAIETYIDWSEGYLFESGILEAENNSTNDYVTRTSLDKFSSNMDEKIFRFLGIFICNTFATLSHIGLTFMISLYFELSSIKDKVDYLLIWKAFTLANIGKFLLFPVLIWGSEYDFSIHSILVFGYVFLALINIQSVIFRCSKLKSFLIFAISYMMKFIISHNLHMIVQYIL